MAPRRALLQVENVEELALSNLETMCNDQVQVRLHYLHLPSLGPRMDMGGAWDWGLELEADILVDSSAAIGVVSRRGAGKLRHVRVG